MVNTNIKELSMKFHYNQMTFLFITNIFAKKAMAVILNEEYEINEVSIIVKSRL